MKHIMLITFIVSILILAAACSTTNKSITGAVIASDAIVAEQQTPSVPDTCTDSDDGIKEAVKGKVTGTLNRQPYEIEDNCIRRQMLIEYYCDGSQYKNKNIACPCFEDVC